MISFFDSNDTTCYETIANIIDDYSDHKDKQIYLTEFMDNYVKITKHDIIRNVEIFEKVINADVELVINYLMDHCTHINDNLDNAICEAFK